jgi:hypothetical protein
MGEVAAAKQMARIPGAAAAAQSDSLSPIRKLAARSTGQHWSKSSIIPGAGFRQSLILGSTPLPLLVGERTVADVVEMRPDFRQLHRELRVKRQQIVINPHRSAA